jgi:hypothetical protein
LRVAFGLKLFSQSNTSSSIHIKALRPGMASRGGNDFGLRRTSILTVDTSMPKSSAM